MKKMLPSPSMVVALLALAVALSGSAYAVSKVGTSQIKNNAVTTPKIRNNAVTAPKIRNGAVTASKIATGALPTAQGSWVDTDFFSLTDSFQEVVHQDLAVRPGQMIIASAVTDLFQFGSGSDTRAWCRLWGYPPAGGPISAYVMSPVMYESLGTAGQDIEFPVVGHHLADESGIWRLRLECRKAGAATVNHSASSIIAWVADPNLPVAR